MEAPPAVDFEALEAEWAGLRVEVRKWQDEFKRQHGKLPTRSDLDEEAGKHAAIPQNQPCNAAQC